MDSMIVPDYEDTFHTITESAQTRGGPWHVTNTFAGSVCVWNQITQEKRFYDCSRMGTEVFYRAVGDAQRLNLEQRKIWFSLISPVRPIKRCFSIYFYESRDGHVVVVGCAENIKGYMETGLILPCSLGEGQRIVNEMNKQFGVSVEEAMLISVSTL